MCMRTEKIEIFQRIVNPWVTLKIMRHLKECAQQFRNNLTKTSKKW